MKDSKSKQYMPVAWMFFFIFLGIIGAFVAQPLVISLGVMGFITCIISVIWNLLSLEEMSYERKFFQRNAFKGEDIPMTVTLSNKKPIPLTRLNLSDELPDELQVLKGEGKLTGKQKIQILNHATSMRWYERLRWEYTLRCTRRGIQKIGPAKLESGDPFGFLNSTRSESHVDSLMVYPAVASLGDLGIPSARPLGETRGGLQIYEDPSRFFNLRDYRRGDPLKTIDWKATARLQRLITRTYEPSTSITVILVVAVDTKDPYWDNYDTDELERVITAAASVAMYAAQEEYTIGVFANDGPIQPNRPLLVQPARGPDQIHNVLSALALLRMFAFGPMSQRLAENANKLPVGSTIVVCSAFISPEFVIILTDLKNKGHKVVVVYVGPGSCPTLPDGVLVYPVRENLIEKEIISEPVSA